MVKQKHYLALTNEEWRLMIECLNKLRNRLISGGKYTDAVDEVIIKTDERTGLKMSWSVIITLLPETMSRRKSKNQSGYGVSGIFAI